MGNKFAVAIGVMPHTRSDAAQCLARAQQYTSLAQRADWSPELRRALARRVAECLRDYDAAQRAADANKEQSTTVPEPN